jgi:hypothetical protein
MMGATILRVGRRLETTGETAIREADIQLNAITYDWVGTQSKNLARVVAHEVGHVLGLADACTANRWHAAAGGRPCSEASAAVQRSAMFPALQPASVPVVLASAERKFLCEIYPAN